MPFYPLEKLNNLMEEVKQESD